MRPLKGPARDQYVTLYYSNRLCERLADQVMAMTPPCLFDRPEVQASVADAEVEFLIALSNWQDERQVESGQRIQDASAGVIAAYRNATMRFFTDTLGAIEPSSGCREDRG